MHIAIVVYAIAAVEKVFRTIGSLLLLKTDEMDRSHQCSIDHSLYLDLKPVYGAVTKDAGEMALDKLEDKWGDQFPIVIKSWRDNRDRLSEFFQYSEPIRKLIYTTNTVEGYHRQIRKVTKNKGVFPNDTALVKLVYLAYRNARKKWTMPVPNWGIISQQLAIQFEDRYNLL